MVQTTLFLKTPGDAGPPAADAPAPLGRLLLAAVFAASSAIAFAAVVILGAPGSGPPAAASAPLQATAGADVPNLPLRP